MVLQTETIEVNRKQVNQVLVRARIERAHDTQQRRKATTILMVVVSTMDRVKAARKNSRLNRRMCADPLVLWCSQRRMPMSIRLRRHHQRGSTKQLTGLR